MQLLSVNQAIASATELHRQWVQLEGLFTYEYEDISIRHWTKAEQTNSSESSIGIVVNYLGVFSFNHSVLARLSNKRVVVFGKLQNLDDVDYMPFCPLVQIVATRLESLKQWKIHHVDSAKSD